MSESRNPFVSQWENTATYKELGPRLRNPPTSDVVVTARIKSFNGRVGDALNAAWEWTKALSRATNGDALKAAEKVSEKVDWPAAERTWKFLNDPKAGNVPVFVTENVEAAIDEAFVKTGLQKMPAGAPPEEFARIAEGVQISPLSEQLLSDIQAARQAGLSDTEIVKAMKDANLDMQKPTSAGLAAAKKRIEELTTEVEKLRKQPPIQMISPLTGKPEKKTGPLNYTEDQVELLFSYFKTQLERSLKREPTAPERARFDEFIDRVQRVKPAVRFERLKGQVEDLATAIGAVVKGAGIPARREKVRVSELLEAMLTRELSPEEEEELMRLSGELEQPGELPLGLEEPQFERPMVRLIAEDGPKKFALGTPLEKDKDYPREVMRVWEVEGKGGALENKERLEKKGYKIRVEDFRLGEG